jgi:uncharacterized cupredoxin-like copper-binding protein
MHRSRATLLVSAAGLCLLAGLLSAVFLARPTSGQAATSAASKTTIVVTAGKPSEFGFQLSSRKATAGVVVFKVTNKGKVPHTFEICTTATSTKANTCKGTVTKSLAPGKTQTLTVNLKKGNHEYICTVPGHAKLGMKGVLGVGVTPPVTVPTPTTTTPPRTTTTVTTQGTCASPVASTVTVNEFDFGFTLSPSSAHCGAITFVQTNSGNTEHNFNINGMAAAIIQSGQSTTNTFTLGPGTFDYQCDVPGHVGLGMFGKFTVTA